MRGSARRWMLLGALAAGLILAAGAAEALRRRAGLDLFGDPYRLTGFITAWGREGCWPQRLPIACHVDGRAWRAQNAGRAWSVAAEGKDGERFELRQGDVWSRDLEMAHRTDRTELSDIVRQPFGRPIAFSFVVRLDPGPATTADFTLLGQLHHTPDDHTEALNPPVWMHGLAPGDRYRVYIGVAGRPAGARLVYATEPLQRGRAYAFRYVFNLDPEGAGRLEIWQDRVLKAVYRGPLGYRDRAGPYFKYGLYRDQNGRGETVVAHFSDVRLQTRTR